MMAWASYRLQKQAHLAGLEMFERFVAEWHPSI